MFDVQQRTVDKVKNDIASDQVSLNLNHMKGDENLNVLREFERTVHHENR